jgi:hypothetical protein
VKDEKTIQQTMRVPYIILATDHCITEQPPCTLKQPIEGATAAAILSFVGKRQNQQPMILPYLMQLLDNLSKPPQNLPLPHGKISKNRLIKS